MNKIIEEDYKLLDWYLKANLPQYDIHPELGDMRHSVKIPPIKELRGLKKSIICGKKYNIKND